MFKTELPAYYFRYFAAIITMSIAMESNGQNKLPTVSNLSYELSRNQKKINVFYDVNDEDSPQVEVFLAVELQNGDFRRIESTSLIGDVGFPIGIGINKKIKLPLSKLGLSTSDFTTCKVKLFVNDKHIHTINDLVQQVDTVSLKEALLNVYGIRNYKQYLGKKNIEKTKKYILNEFQKYELSTTKQPFHYLNYPSANVIGAIKGDSVPNEVFVLGAHFDTVIDSPGADDNASGVIGMLEVMKIMSQYSFARSIEFVGFDLEEDGHIGSKHYVKEIKRNGVSNIFGSINFDMIGYYSNKPRSQKFPKGFDKVFPKVYNNIMQDSMRGNFAVLISNESTAKLCDKYAILSKKYIPELKLASLYLDGDGHSFPDLRRSDHASFWDEGFPSIYIGDGAYSRNPNYHSSKDKLATINLQHIANVTKATIALMAQTAELRKEVKVKNCFCDKKAKKILDVAID